MPDIFRTQGPLIGQEGLQENLPGLLATAPILGGTQATWPTVNRLYGVRVVAPRACTIHDMAISVAVQSGNISLAIYDTGDTSSGTYTALWRSGAPAGTQTACPATGSWAVIGDPALAVYAGQQLIFAMSCDNLTASFLKTTCLGAAALPTNFIPCIGGASPKPVILENTAHPAPSSITEANAAANANYAPIIIARYV